MKFKAVCFDLDGVIIDSERKDQQWNAEFCRIHHFHIDPREFYRLIGGSKGMNILETIYEKINTDIPYPQFQQMYRAYKQHQREILDYGSIVFDDVVPFLKWLKHNSIPCCIASSSNMAYIEHAVDQGNLKSYFNFFVTGDDFKQSKPNPDIYLHCMERFGTSPTDTLVIEDSPYGIMAGRNAGCFVSARKDTTFGLDQSKANLLFDNLMELTVI